MSVPRRKIAGWLLTLALFGAGIVIGSPVFAQASDSTGMMSTLQSFGANTGLATDTDVVTIIARIIRVLLSFLGILALGIVLWGGFKYMTSGGVEDKVKSAKKLMVSGLIGLVIILSAYTITAYIFRALGTVFGDVTYDNDGDSDDYCDGGCTTSNLFEVSSVNTECAEAILNFQPQITFSKSVSSATVQTGISIKDGTGTPVAGSFAVSGSRVTFTPSTACTDFPEENCFDGAGSYSLTIDDTIVKSTGNTSLTCSSEHPCSYSFTVGSAVDVDDPTVEMDAPEDGAPVFANDIELLQTQADDDSGVSSVDFTVDGDIVFQASLVNSSAGALALENIFSTDSTQWDTAGYSEGSYSIRAEGYDCAGHSTTSSAVDVVLYPAHCNDGHQGVAPDEVPEDGIDCGGEDCGACDDSPCDDNSDCASGYCEIIAPATEGTCVSIPEIEEVSPGDGAVGNLITIAGSGFGTTAGTITFVGSEDDVGDDVTISAYECDGTTEWSDEEIIIQLTDEMAEGAIKVTTSTGYTDTTNDDYGPTIADFDINLVVRPGLCSLTPNTGEATTPVAVAGNNLGDSQGSSTVYFGTYEASDYGSWSDESISNVVVPLVNARGYNTQVWTGDYVCQTSAGAATETVCSADADCDTEAGETCATGSCTETGTLCVEDEDCGDEGGECESLRHGSNKVEFTVTDSSSGETPVISQIDTGWTACSGGFDDGARCAVNADCSSGTCADASPWGPTEQYWGPPEQYVTIYGSNFGSSTGFVHFSTDSSAAGTEALGNTEFPDSCGDDQWDDTQIIVKVPSTFTNEAAIEAGTFTLTVETAEGLISDGTDFVILDDEAGPSICAMDPSAGPEDTTVSLAGENFGGSQGDGYVTFYNDVAASVYNSWANISGGGSLISTDVPEGSDTGPVTVTSSEGYTSNSVNFIVGNCTEDDSICGTGEECCADGSCQVAGSCGTSTPVESHYAWLFSTGPLPTTPTVLVQCDENYISPSPWSGWNTADEICVNATVTAAFSVDMSTASYPGNITVESCGLYDGGVCASDADCSSGTCEIPAEATTGTCSGTADSVCSDEATRVVVDGSVDATRSTVRTAYWQPTEDFDPNTIYLVTVHATDDEYTGVLSASPSYETMAADYSWTFVTADSTDLCEVDDVYLAPPSHMLSEEGDTLDYSASPLANRCVVLACSEDYDWTWTSSQDGNAPLTSDAGTGSNGCVNVATAEGETAANDPALIEAEINNVTNTPSDVAELTINYSDPEVTSYTPACDSACINAAVYAEFNISMQHADGSTDFDKGNTVWLYECQDALCDDGEVTDVEQLSEPLSYSVSYVDTTDNHRLTLTLGEGENFEVGTYYRVRISGNVTSNSGVPLSQSGSNYGSDNNRAFPDAFSWIFRTKDDATVCEIDRVDVTPSNADTRRIGETTAFIATPYGEPDDCSASGQALDENDYTWLPWTAADAEPDFKIDSSEDVATMLEDGSILQSSVLPNGCSSSCLNTGSAVGYGDPVCGDNYVDTEAEECDDGGTVSGDGCSSTCLLEGQAACEYVCYTGGERSEATELSVSCDGTDDTSSCVAANPDGSDATCLSTEATCCGDGTVNGDEQCDDGDSESGDGCSSLCLNEGSQTTCGDGTVDFSTSLGGEDCDDGDDEDGDGCSSTCRYEGSIAEGEAYSTCGNNVVEEGEDCDDNNLTDGDGCSSSCLHEGTDECVYECYTGGVRSESARTGDSCNGVSDSTCSADGSSSCLSTSASCCGDNSVGTGEDCDDGNDDDGDGCSSECLNEGAGLYDEFTAICGDGETEYLNEDLETYTSEECEATTTGSVGGYGVSVIEPTAPLEVSPSSHTAAATITATAGDPAVEGEADLTLTCACNSDASCAETTAELSLYGCGTSNCCYDRPSVVQAYPADTQDNVCLNTAVWVDFSTEMDSDTFNPESEPNLYLELVTDSSGSVITQSTCPESYTDATVSLEVVQAPTSFFGRTWNWVSQTVRGWFGSTASAARYACLTPVTYVTDEAASATGSRVRLMLSEALQADSEYRLVAVGDDTLTDETNTGLLANGVGLKDASYLYEFTTGDEICTLDVVTVEDLGRTAYVDGSDPLEEQSSEYYTSSGEEHQLQATGYTINGSDEEEIVGIEGVYDWTWSWSSSVNDSSSTTNVITVASAATTQTGATSSGVTGQETAYATAATNDYDDSTTDESVEGTVLLVANTCENPWPAVADYPYVDSDSNFSFFYCRDAGEEDDTSDDLPELATPISVTSSTVGSLTFVQELIFRVNEEDENDAVGVRVIQNADYYPPDVWYDEQGFTGSPSSTEVDGYEAVKDGNTYYVAAANQTTGGSVIYPNIYVLSYNEDASDNAQEIFDQIVANWSFNANTDTISDNNNCTVDGDYPTDEEGAFIECTWRGSCIETCEDSVCSLTGDACTTDADCELAEVYGPDCDAEKAQLTRDMRRLTDLVRMQSALDDYGETNGHCEVTTAQECTADSDCPGTESCEAGVPLLASGTLVRAMAVSAWSSWVSELDNEVGETLPVDPVNAFYNCTESGYDAATCWEPVSSTFTCPAGSHVYGYLAQGNEGYDLHAQLEYASGGWYSAIDGNMSDDENIIVHTDFTGTLQNGFKDTAQLCGDGQCSYTSSRSCVTDADCPDTETCLNTDQDWGNSDRCGDGVQGSGETCEIGDTDVVDCASADGTVVVRCNDSCTGYETAAVAEAAGADCVEYECGNGVTETEILEECDDGELNGTYGHCGDNCTLDTAFGCGDGYLAGGESCDCGTVSNASELSSDSASWAYTYCDLPDGTNGQYSADMSTSCAFDCTSPGPSCGDAAVNGAEECDGDYETWEGALCVGGDNDGESCSTDSDCDGGQCGGSSGYESCTASQVCEGGADEGEACTSGTSCDSGVCSTYTYQLSRARTCSNSCEWNSTTNPGGWTACMVLNGTCGNGETDGDEACDDGNDDNTDACTNECQLNVCGDDFVYSGVESCDDGGDNGATCDATYGGVCYYCTETCQYKSRSGAYCGDEVINGDEFCDGSAVPYYIDVDADDEVSLQGTCDEEDIGTGSITVGSDTYTCRRVGVCNGGADNGNYCTYTTSSVYSMISLGVGDDTITCASGGTCVPPTCAADCGSTCPVTYSSIAVNGQTEEVGASPESSLTLYKYNMGTSPDNGALFVPACSVATSLTAQVDTSDVVLPDLAVVFVTDLSSSMNNPPDGDPDGERRIDILTNEMSDAIDRLYDAYAGSDSTIQVGLVSLSTRYDYDNNTYDVNADCTTESDEYFCDASSPDRDGANTDLALSEVENDVLAKVSQYSSCVFDEEVDCNSDGDTEDSGEHLTSGSNPNWAGLDVASDMLDGATADVKILVFMSDGDQRFDASFPTTGDGDYCDCVDRPEDCSDGPDTHQTSFAGFLGDPGCVAEANYRVETTSTDITVYTAGVTTDDEKESNMAHISSEECNWSSDSDDWEGDCTTGTYAFSGDSSEDIQDMYDSILDSILGVRLNYTYSNDGSSTQSTEAVNEGQYVSVPLPEHFECEDEEQTVPITFDFYGSGSVTLSNIQLNYCPSN